MFSRAPVGDVKRLFDGTLSAAATLDIVLTAYASLYKGFVFQLHGWRPATDDVELWMRLSTDGGSSYGAASYSTTNMMTNVGTVETLTTTSALVVAGGNGAGEGIGNVAPEHASVNIWLPNAAKTTHRPTITADGNWFTPSTGHRWVTNRGMLAVAQDTDAVRFLFESGNIAEGSYTVLGVK